MEIFGVRVDPVTFDEAVERVVTAASRMEDKPFFVATPNPEQIVEAQGNESFRDALNAADLAIPDGYGVVVASMLLKGDIRERVSGIEMMEKLIEGLAHLREGSGEVKKVMLVGGHGDVAARAADKLQSSLTRPGLVNVNVKQDRVLSITGIEGISYIKRADKGEEKRLIEQINEYGPDLLFVGFGAPWQELFVARNLGKLNVKVVMVVGGTFDQIANPSLRPPTVIDRMGLGWLYRLVRQPWRIGRQLRLIQFGWMVLKTRLG